MQGLGSPGALGYAGEAAWPSGYRVLDLESVGSNPTQNTS